MSARADCLIIGGGVIGLSIARRLAVDGIKVILLERTECGKEASWAGAGILAPCNPHRNDPLSKFQDRSLEIYPSFCAALRDETAIDPEYDPSGEFDLLFTENSVSIARSDAAAAAGRVAHDGGAAFELLIKDEVIRMEPCVAPTILGALYCRMTSQVRNPRLLQALAASCRRRGVEVRERTPVQGLTQVGEKVTGVETPDGRFEAPHTILSAGAWSSQFDARLASIMPVHPVRGQMILLKVDSRPFCRIISRGKTYLVPRSDGHVLLGSTEEPEAGYVKRNSSKAMATLMQTATQLVPSLERAEFVAAWSGFRPGTPDERPYIGPVPGFEGLIAATGHYRAGLTLAPATADAVAAIVQNRTYDLDLRCCLPGRAVGT